MNTLHLTNDERQAFDALSPALRDGWEVVEETGNAYETDEALKIRAHMSSLSELPHVKQMMDEVNAGRPPQAGAFHDLPEKYHKDFFFTIGARGIAMLIGELLKEMKTDDDIEGIAWLSKIRHEILENNASVTFA